MDEGARLEIACAGRTGTEGSNPSLSAILVAFAEKVKVLLLIRERAVFSGEGEPDGEGPGNPVRPEREQR